MELIDRQAVYKFACNGCTRHGENIGECYHDEPCEKLIAEFTTAPTVDAVPVVHGRWIPIEYDGFADGNPVWDLWECSECQEEHRGDEDTLTPYCPNCGAKMDEKPDGNFLYADMEEIIDGTDR